MTVSAIVDSNGNAIYADGTALSTGAPTSNVEFDGAGNLSASTRAKMAVRATFGGSGRMFASLGLKTGITGRFGGSGSMLMNALPTFVIFFNGSSSLTANLFRNPLINARFHGRGRLQVDTVFQFQMRATFHAAGSLCCNLWIRPGPKGITSNLEVDGPGVTDNVVIV